MSEADIDQELPEQQTPAVEVTPEPPAKEEPQAPDPKDLGKTLRYNMERINKAAEEKAKAEPQQQAKAPPTNDGKGRDDKGRFVKPAEQPKDDKQVSQKPPAEKPAEAAKPGAAPKAKDEAPGTWRADAKRDWAQAPASVKAEALRRESELTQAVAKRDQQIAGINQAYGGIEKLIGPRRAAWAADHGSSEAALGKLLAINDLAANDPNAFLARYLSYPHVAASVDLQKIFGQGAQGGDINAHPTVQALRQEIDGLKQQFTGFSSQHVQQQTSQTEQAVKRWAEATDAGGNPLRPHFDAVRAEVYEAIPGLRATYPNYTVEQIMDLAYAIKTAANPEISQMIEQDRAQKIRDDIEKQQRLERAKIANKSGLPNAPAGEVQGEQVNPKDLRGQIKNAFRLQRAGETARI